MPDTFDRLKAALADRYAIERELGSGGMATVYLAEDLKLHPLRRALAAARRRWLGTRIVPSMWEATFWRIEGDLARQLGDTTAAIDAYQMYLRLRYDPEPRFVAEVEGVKDALAELTGERGR